MPVFRGPTPAAATLAITALCPCPAPAQTYDNQTLTGTTVIPDGTTASVINNLTLDNAQVDVYGQLEFLGLNTLSGAGRINLFNTGDIRINAQAGGPGATQQLTVMSGIEIVGNRDGGPSNPGISFNRSFQQDTLINYGVIAAEGDASELNPDLFVGNNNLINHGTFAARQGGIFRANWDSGWSNPGTFLAEDGGLFSLGGTFSPADLGTLVAEGSGIFSLNATVNNAGNTWTLDQTTGPLQLESSTINGGAIVGLDGVKLFSVFSGRQLYTLNLNDGVVLDIDADIQGRFADVNVAGGLTINRDFLFNGDDLTFNGDQTLGGTGELRLQDRVHLNGDLTIAAGMTVTSVNSLSRYESAVGSELRNEGTMIDIRPFNASSNTVSLLNLGTVLARRQTVTLPDQAVNQGLLAAEDRGLLRVDDFTQHGQMHASNGGRLVVNGGTNTAGGTITADTGGQLWLLGTITNNGGIAVNGGQLLWEDPTIIGNAVSVTNSTVVFTADRASDQLPAAGLTRVNSGWGLAGNATLDNTGRTIDLTSDPLTQWTLFGGTVLGGVIDSPDATPLRVETYPSSFSSVRATLDGVEVRAPVAIGPDAQLDLINGALLLGPVTLDQGTLNINQPMNPATLPQITGPGGQITLTRSADLAGQSWNLPAAVQTLELRASSNETIGDQPLVLNNGSLVGGPDQRLVILGGSSNFPNSEQILRDLTLAINTLIRSSYTTAGIEGTVTLQGSEIEIFGGVVLSTGELIRHGELRIASAASLTGSGTVRFGSSGIGAFSTTGSELLIDTGITVVGGDTGIGWVGSDGATTRNLGTLEVHETLNGEAGLRFLGDGLNNEGTINIFTGGRIEVVGEAALGGTLDVQLAPGFHIASGETLTVLTAGSATGVFDNVQLPDLPYGGALFALQYRADSVWLEALAAYSTTPGDLDGDGDADDADFGLLFGAFSGPYIATSNPAADLDGDGDVDDADYGLAFAAFTGPSAAESVPEPSGAVLLMLAGACVGRRRRA